MQKTGQYKLEHQDYSVSTATILLHAIWMTVIFLIVPLLPFAWIWGKDPLFAWFSHPNIIAPALLLIVAHELIHAIGWKVAGNVPWREFRFGIAWKTLTPYCHTSTPMTAKAYRFGTVLPGILLGVVPIFYATIVGDAFVAVLGALLTAGAVGDVYVMWLIRSVPASAIVQDHPKRAGCIVLGAGETP